MKFKKTLLILMSVMAINSINPITVNAAEVSESQNQVVVVENNLILGQYSKNPFQKELDNPIVNNMYTISGDSHASVDQMVKYFNDSNGVYPSSLSQKGASTIEEFCEQVYNICEEYNVRSEVVFAQICQETGFLKYFCGCNFCGYGGGGTKFKNVEAGLTAQIKQLALYSGDMNSTNNIDDKNSVYYGKAPYIEWLYIPNNPYKYGWAMDKSYSKKLQWHINKICEES